MKMKHTIFAALFFTACFGVWAYSPDVRSKYYMAELWVRVNWLGQKPLVMMGSKQGRVISFDYPGVMVIDEPMPVCPTTWCKAEGG